MVTGALGQLGRALKTALANHEVVALPRVELDIATSTRCARWCACTAPI